MPNHKTLTLCLVLLVLQQNLAAQYNHDTSRYNVFYGSAKQLHGNVKVINCFVSAGKKGWSIEEKNRVLAQQEHGRQWILRQATKYWQVNDLSITTSTFGLENDIKLEKIERDAEPNKLHVNWVPLVLNAIGYNNIPYFCDSINKANQPDNVVVLIFAKKPGRSYAQPSNSNNVLNQRFLEGAVIYSEGFEGYELSDATIVHEMLHLFGAWDIYNSYMQKPEVEAKARAVFPTSIMLDTHRDLNPLMIDQLTAWCIGWIKSYWDWYEYFRPSIDKKDKELMKLVEPNN